MAVTVKPMVYVSKPDDKLVVVDVYGGNAPPKSPTNLLKAVETSTHKALNKALVINKDGKSLFKKAADYVLSGRSFKGKDFAKHMLGEVFPNARTSINDLKGELLNTVGASLGLNAETAEAAYRATKDGDYNDVLNVLATTNPLAKFYVEGREIVKKAEDIDDVSDLFSLAGDIFGSTDIGKVLNLGEEFKVMKALVDTAMELRVPELADYLIDKVENKNKDKLVRGMFTSGARYGDVNTLYRYIDSINAIELFVEEPDILKYFVQFYKFPEDTGPSKDNMDKVMIILDKISPGWNTVSEIIDGQIWLNASQDMKTLIYTDGRFSYILATMEGEEMKNLYESASVTTSWAVLDNSRDQNYF